MLELSFNSEQKTIDLLGNGQIKEPVYARILPDGESQNEISVEIQEGWNEVTVELPKDYLMKSIRFIPYEGSGIIEHLQIIGYGNSESEMSYNWTSAQKLGNESFFVHMGNHMNEMNYLINEEYSALKIKYRLVPFYGERELYAAGGMFSKRNSEKRKARRGSSRKIEGNGSRFKKENHRSKS